VIASELGLDGFRRLRKADLIDAIVERQGGDGEKAASGEAGKDAEPEAKTGGEEPEPEADVESDTETERPRRRRRGGRGRGRRNAERDADENGDSGAGGDDGRKEDGRKEESRDRESRDRVVRGRRRAARQRLRLRARVAPGGVGRGRLHLRRAGPALRAWSPATS